MNWERSPLLRALGDPGAVQSFGPADWDLAVRQGRSAGLLGRLGARIESLGLKTAVPAAAWRHMEALLTIAERQKRAVLWEVKQLARALEGTDTPVLLLKGAAYAAADLPPAAGRTFSDIDILVPKAALGEVEKRLMLAGWISSHHDAYDQRYYRQWMHELPPMTHLRRGTNLDVHHNILPETARIRTRPDLILAAATRLGGFDNILIPSPEDQVLHSATHLYHEGEWGHGLRDLSDLDCLLRAYTGDAAFLARLTERARTLNLAMPLGYALDNARAVLGTPVPEDALGGAGGRPGKWRGRVMNRLFLSALGGAHPSLANPFTASAAGLLYVRSHWLRMPLRLLIPHLLHQALRPFQADGSNA